MIKILKITGEIIFIALGGIKLIETIRNMKKEKQTRTT
jgi:hypothetical protein